MKHSGIDIRIRHLVVDASRHSEAAGLADAIGQALQQRLTGSANEASAAHAEAPRAVADRIAARLTTTSGADAPRGKP
ncbi:hypothetical protein ABIB94_008266 [Bradyrhizobium sp. JR7.2]|jgi:hypothetical protein|uniref:Uncharacterized protein n=1 Tax=Bradyrhizobium japonicum TaxID=375 RepID=A0A1Y2J6A2_BRAJP|nr:MULTISPECIES: hypothetical protein [Bradyrhizobium]OSJ21266.1 hypothetical protein BSZ19_48445 [Bradyrhizobium japonicum]WFT93142.1 hypothetical protein QA633_33210 [Bradyrhizobium barranii]